MSTCACATPGRRCEFLPGVPRPSPRSPRRSSHNNAWAGPDLRAGGRSRPHRSKACRKRSTPSGRRPWCVCVIHLLRNTFRYAARQNWDAIARDIKPVYTAPTAAAAAARFAEFADTWGSKYAAAIGLWPSAREEFTPFLSYDVEIRRVICTTNAIWVAEWALSAGPSGHAATSRPTREPALRGAFP